MATDCYDDNTDSEGEGRREGVDTVVWLAYAVLSAPLAPIIIAAIVAIWLNRLVRWLGRLVSSAASHDTAEQEPVGGDTPPE
jgi:hypothetical protein